MLLLVFCGKKKKMKTYIRIILYIFVIIILCSSTTTYADSSLFFTKSNATVSEGDQITVSVKVKATDQAINAVSGSILFPGDLLKTVSISRDNSILNIWTHDPNITRNKITFEGVILNPGYKGDGGSIFHITFEAKKTGTASISFSEGALLANDGHGTNIISALSPTSFSIIGSGALDLVERSKTIAISNKKIMALPVITEYSSSIFSKENAYLKGKGAPNALTKISFEDVAQKSFGEQFMDFIQSKKKRLTDVLVKNNDKGLFEYTTPNNLIAGVYNATPYLVDAETNTDKPGLGVQMFVNDSKIVKGLIVFINILILLIPVVGLIMLIYFIPWYSARRMRIMKRRMGLEEEKIELTEHELERQDKRLSQESLAAIHNEKKQ